MAKYSVNKNINRNGDHEVHKEGCPWLPKLEDRKDLGEHSNCDSAVKEAKKHYIHVNGHRYCSKACHTS